MWQKKKTSRWDVLKTDKPKSPVKSRWGSPKIDKPPITNSRWKLDSSPISKPKTELPVNSRWDKSPSSPIRRVEPTEKTWEEILNEKIKINEIKRNDTPINTRVPDDEVETIINCLTCDRRRIKQEIKNYKKMIDTTTSENQYILKQREDIELQQKKRALQDLEMKDNKKIIRGYKADLEKVKKILRKNRNEELNETMSRLKKKYIANRKIINRNKSNLSNHLYELERISKRMDYLIGLLHESNTTDAWYMEQLFKSQTMVNPKIVSSPIETETENVEESWWSRPEDIIKVSIKDWSKDLKIENLIDCDSKDSDSNESDSEENKDNISESSEKVQEVKNPYADWDSDAIRKKVRFYNKKLRQISKLEKREDLSEAELNKIKQRENYEYELKLLNEIKPQ